MSTHLQVKFVFFFLFDNDPGSYAASDKSQNYAKKDECLRAMHFLALLPLGLSAHWLACLRALSCIRRAINIIVQRDGGFRRHGLGLQLVHWLVRFAARVVCEE